MKKKDVRYETILFCAAFCPASRSAFSLALDMAAHYGARMIVLHIIAARHRYSGILATEKDDVCLTAGVIEEYKCRLIDYYLSNLDKRSLAKIDVLVRGGIPWVEILRVARKERVDHIIMGCSGDETAPSMRSASKTPPGLTARLVSSRASCPVSVVAGDTRAL